MDGACNRICALGRRTGNAVRMFPSSRVLKCRCSTRPESRNCANRSTALTSDGMGPSILTLPIPKQTWAPPGGYPKLKPKPGRAADFVADTIRANPGEVVLYCAGPLTNIALAIRMDPEIVAADQSHLHHGRKQLRRPGAQLVVGPGGRSHRAARAVEGRS